MPHEQPELSFAPVAAKHPRHADLVAALAGQGWMSRRQLEAHGFNDRELREICEADTDRRIFSYPGSPGYKLMKDVTMEEFRHVYALGHQATQMQKRLAGYLAAWHRLGRKAP